MTTPPSVTLPAFLDKQSQRGRPSGSGASREPALDEPPEYDAAHRPVPVPRLELRGQSLLNSIDLAFQACRWQWRGLLLNYLAITIPTALLVAWLSSLDLRMAALAPVLWLLVSGPLGAMVATAMVSLLMGQAETYREGLKSLTFSRLTVSLLRRVAALCGLFLCGVGGLLAAVGLSFRPENDALKDRRRRGHEHRLKQLVKSHYSDLVIEAGLLALWTACLAVVLLITLDVMAEVWFGASFCLGPVIGIAQGLSATDESFDEIWRVTSRFLATDPRLLFAETFCVLAAFVVGRVAWLCVYVNLRVRDDCWDLELAMNSAAAAIRQTTRQAGKLLPLILATMLAWGGMGEESSSRAGAAESNHPILPPARKILEQPEFRYFDHFNGDDVDGLEGFRRWNQSSGSGSGEGGEAGEGNGTRSSGSRTLPGSMRSRKQGSGRSGKGAGDGGGEGGGGGRDGGAGSSDRWNGRPRSSRAQDDSSSRRASNPSTSSSSGSSSSSSGPRMDLGAAFGLGALGTALAYLLVGLICVGIIAAVVMSIIAAYKNRSQTLPTADRPVDVREPDVEPGLIPADVYLARADELARAGRYRDAVAQLLLSGMSFAERAGMVRYRRGMTLRDYQRSMGFGTPIHQG
ncbi:MAG: hypothetical protein C0478_02520, partial [Planctomyces sp.]|nr:hypothetical protein [Planctomyces sp.]